VTPRGRNRSEGWRHAKLDGHANEREFAESLITNREFISVIEMKLLNVSSGDLPEVVVDGSKRVDSIFDDKTTSKVDLALIWKGGQKINISLKKSKSGQVWIISVPRFISAIEHHLNRKLDPEVYIGISLFIGGTNLSNYESYFDQAIVFNQEKNPSIAKQELHQSRLVGKSIATLFPTVWSSMLDFFNSNIGLITKLSFSQGLAKSEVESADVIVYNQTAEEESVFAIRRVIQDSVSSTQSNPVTAGPKNGGSTLQLPTGFLQMHRPQGDNLLQFHHQYEKISKLSFVPSPMNP
jgi:hypothetical protein